MTKEECIQELGLSGDPSMDEIKKAYRKLANKYHPDKADGDSEKFTTVSDAYRRLKKNDFVDADGRKHYYNNAAGYGKSHMNDIFDEMLRKAGFGGFGGAGYGGFDGFEEYIRQAQANQSRKITTFTITLKDIFHGGTAKVGNEHIAIPKGVPTNTIFSTTDGTEVKFRLKHTGDEKIFRRDDHSADLLCIVTIPIINLITGAMVTMNHPSGEQIEVEIPSGIESTSTIRVKGQGLPVWQNDKTRGDLYIKLNTYTPKFVSDKEMKKLKKMFEQKFEV